MTIKKLLSFVLCLALLFSCLVFTNKMPTAKGGKSEIYESTEPVIPSENDFSYEMITEFEEDGVIITAYHGKETKIIIPETLGGSVVSDIASDVFAGNESLTYIKLPSGLMFIGGDAFKRCSSLTQIDVDENNPYFISVDGVLYYKNTDENSEFYGKPLSLSNFPAGKGGSFTIPYGVKTIGAYAFNYCYNLTEVIMYNTVTAINGYAFSFCWNLERIRLSDNLRFIRKEAFAHCPSLKRVDLPSNILNIGEDAFLGNIDSDDNKVYYFINGISCTNNSYAHQYLKKQGLPESIIILNNPSVTDADTGIKLIDAYTVLPKNEMLDITVEPVDLTEVEGLFPTRYAEALVYDINITKNGESFTPDGNLILSFETVCPDAIPSATKVYQQIDDRLVLVSGAAHTPFVCAQISSGGRFVVLMNNDFSLKGDIDGDGVVSLFDVKSAMHTTIGTLMLTPEQALAANVDNSEDGKITTEDARKILRLAGGMSIE